MSSIPNCPHCNAAMRQEGRYADWHCDCCDRSANCRHVSAWKRLMRRMSGRKV